MNVSGASLTSSDTFLAISSHSSSESGGLTVRRNAPDLERTEVPDNAEHDGNVLNEPHEVGTPTFAPHSRHAQEPGGELLHADTSIIGNTSSNQEQ